MRKVQDLTGNVYGEREVVSFSHWTKTRNSVWSVRCSCGREDKVIGTNLKKSKMCGECAGRVNGRKGLDTAAKGKPVYFIRCGDFFKIGCSDDIPRRLKDMETNNPYELELIEVDEDEQFWHKVFAHRHHRGEWYRSCEIVDLT